MSYTSTFIIEELTAPGGRSPRSITLLGAGLPLVKPEWSGESVIVTQWNPGNGDEATQQIIVPKLLPSTFRFDWRRTLLGDSPAQFSNEFGQPASFVDPIDLCEAFESIRVAGQRLRVTWAVSGTDASSTGRVVRVGRLKKFRFQPTRIQDIEADAEFEWSGKGQTTPRVTSVRGPTINTESAAYIAAINKLIAANILANLQSQNPGSLTLGQIEAVASYPTQLTNSLARQVQQLGSEATQVANIATTLATQPTSVANRAIDLAHNTVAQANNIRDTLSAIPWELQTTKTKMADFVRSAKLFAQQGDAAEDMAQAGINYARAIQRTTQPALSTERNPTRSAANASEQIRVTKEGDTPEKLSSIYYGNPDHGDEILRANKLPWYQATFAPGKILIIPQLASVSSTNQV